MDEEIRERMLIGLEVLHEQFQRREAIGWLVSATPRVRSTSTGSTPSSVPTERSLHPRSRSSSAASHDNSGGEGFKNVIVPLYPPVKWRDES